MRDLAGQLFAIVGRYSEPVTWREAQLYTGYVWESMRPLYQQFELVQDPRSLGSWMEHAEKFVLPEEGGTLLYASASSGSTIAWLNHTTFQWFDIWGHTFSTEGMKVRLKGGGHYAAWTTPTDDRGSIFE